MFKFDHSRILNRVATTLAIVAACMAAQIADGQIVSFNQITQEQGLRNGNVRAIIKDHQGFVWIGTEDGLHRYDGYSMRIYRKDEHDTTSLSSNFILCLFEDSGKNLWAGTLDGSLCLYDRKKDNFIRLGKKLSKRGQRIDEAVRIIHEDHNKQLFIGSGQLFTANVPDHPDSIKIRQVGLPPDAVSKAGIRIMDIKEFSDSLLLVSVNNVGLFLYNPSTNKFYEHRVSEVEKNVQSMYVDKKRKLIWLGTWKNGVVVTDFSGEKITTIKAGNDDRTLRNNYAPRMSVDAEGNLWIATDHGLSRIPQSCDPFVEPEVETYLPDPKNHAGIQGSIVKAVYVDPDDNVWVGTYYSGVSVYNKRSTSFGSILLPAANLTMPDFQSVTGMVQDASKNLWIGTDGSGLYFSTDSIGTRSPVFSNVGTFSGIEKIKCMRLNGNDLWIGTWGKGLFVFNIQTRTCKNFETFNTGVDIGKEIISLAVDSSGDLWIGTFDKGTFSFSRRTNAVVHLANQGTASNFVDRVNVIRQSHDQTIWIGKEAGGLSRTKPESDRYDIVETSHLEPSSSITEIYIDHEEILWIGCPNKGLIRFDPRTINSRLFTEHDGLNNSMIYGILEDKSERLWITTDAGISVFDKKTEKFVNLGMANGLLSNLFNRASTLSSHNGYFLFGNTKGINYIDPDLFIQASRRGKIVFTNLLVNNEEQITAREGSVLKENLSVTNRIDLAHNQSSFAIEVALLTFDFSTQPEYYYKLEGFNDTWQHAGAQRLIQYTNLKPGTYRLNVGTSAKPDIDNSPVSVMTVVIHPAWWQTIPFRIAVFSAVVLLAFVVHRIRIRYLLTQKAHLEEQVAQRTQGLNAANDLLKTKLEEINSINTILNRQQIEIQSQNKELTSQYERIGDQHGKLIEAQTQLRELNAQLEMTVDDRTKTLQNTIDRLNKTVFELDRFVYSASHDLSAPLKSILGLVQIINFEKDPVKATEYVVLVKDTVIKLEAVIKSMVDYARNAHVQVRNECFNLHDLASGVFRELAFLPDAARLNFENRIPKDLRIQNDPERIRVVLNNLVGNGIKYIDKNKNNSVITLDAIKTNARTVIKVSDNGIGIRPELLDKIFNMYFRGTEMSKGSGLGLFIVKETVNKIGGNITVQSTFGVGSTFEVTIPEVNGNT